MRVFIEKHPNIQPLDTELNPIPQTDELHIHFETMEQIKIFSEKFGSNITKLNLDCYIRVDKDLQKCIDKTQSVHVIECVILLPENKRQAILELVKIALGKPKDLMVV